MRQNVYVSSKLIFHRTGRRDRGRMSLLLRRALRATSRASVWLALALVLDAVIAITAILVGGTLNLADLLAAGPLLACARCNGRMTALVAGYAIALCLIVTGVTGTSGTTSEGYRFTIVIGAGVFAVFAAVI